MPKRKPDVKESVAPDNYDSKEYWDKRYDNSNGHEWYYSFDLLAPLIEKYLPTNFDGRVLEIGCGDKPLINSFLLKFTSSSELIGFDYAQNVVDLLNAQKSNDSRLKYQQMDARRTNFLSSSFDFIIDKGTIDAMLCAETEEIGFRNVLRIITEAVRVMKDNAKFMVVSHIETDSCEFTDLMQNAVLPALETKQNVLWSVEAHSVKTSNEDDNGYGTVYVISSSTRKKTRSGFTSGAPVTFKVFEYDSDEEE